MYNRPDSPAYIANVSNVNFSENPITFTNTSFLGLNHFENQSSFTFHNRFLAQFNSYYGFKNGFTLIDGAFGIRIKTKKELLCSLIGYSYGTFAFQENRGYYPSASSSASYFEKKYSILNYSHKFYVQPSYTFITENGMKITLSGRTSFIYYPVYFYNFLETERLGGTGPLTILQSDSIILRKKFSSVLDPALSFSKEGDVFGCMFQIQFNLPLSGTDIKNRDHLINSYWPTIAFGVSWKAGRRSKAQKQE
jgi:hypothetical protein